MDNSNQIAAALNSEKISNKKLVAIMIALIIICSIVVTGVIFYAPRSEGYHVMYLRNAQSLSVNHTQVLVINQNNTLNTQVFVENNNPKPCNYQVQVKIVQDTFYFPINVPAYKTYEFTLEPKQSWTSQVPISINEEGNFSVVFELYAEKEESYRFTNNYCVLHIAAIKGTS